MISVIIPTYRNPQYLDLCLNSATKQGLNSSTEIIVIVDGFVDESIDVLRKYKNHNIAVIEFEQNRGETHGHNTGVALASNPNILIVNDDNVFPLNWEERLSKYIPDLEKVIYAPNQIEPRPSIFPSFIIKDFGIDAQSFDLDAYQTFESTISNKPISMDGQTFPLFMKKKYYMALNGIDVSFPYSAMADWDFFMRAELMGLSCHRINDVTFYHFASAATKKTPELRERQANRERESLEYFNWKWGNVPVRNERNSCLAQSYRGI